MKQTPCDLIGGSLKAFAPEWGIVLGSGLGKVVVRVKKSFEFPFKEVPGLPNSGIAGHSGRFVAGMMGGKRVLIAQGRVHLYEGRTAADVTAGVRLMAKAGVKKLILTNAAGTLNRTFDPGTWMMLSDHINLTGTSPLVGAGPWLGGSQFVDMSEAYSAAMRSHFARVAVKVGFRLNSGVYAGLLGPQYETPAEIRMLRAMGADAVGMSTVLETIQARALGMEVAGFSCLSNWAAGLSKTPLNHEEVLKNVEVAAMSFSKFIEEALG